MEETELKKRKWSSDVYSWLATANVFCYNTIEHSEVASSPGPPPSTSMYIEKLRGPKDEAYTQLLN